MALNSLLARRHVVAGLCCLPALIRQAHAASVACDVQRIAPGVYVRSAVDEDATAHNEDAIANIGFIVGRDAVAVTESGGSLRDGECLRAAIRRVTSLPIRYVLMSHVHPDHIFGAGAFLADKPAFVGHRQLPRALAQRGEYYRKRLEELLGAGNVGPVVQPTLLVEDETQIDLGGRVLELKAHPEAHTNCDLSMFDRKTQTLFPADLLFVRRVPSLDGNLKGWLRELGRLRERGSPRAVPGHGPAVVDFGAASTALEQYLNGLLQGTREAIANGVGIDAAPGIVARSERSKWTLFDDYHAHNVTQAFKELEWE